MVLIKQTPTTKDHQMVTKVTLTTKGHQMVTKVTLTIKIHLIITINTPTDNQDNQNNQDADAGKPSKRGGNFYGSEFYEGVELHNLMETHNNLIDVILENITTLDEFV